MSYTKRPCPGCGQPNRYRSASEVCGHCKKALESWKKHTERTAATALKGDKVLVKLPECTHWWPGFYYGDHAHLSGHSDLRDAMQQVCHDISYRFCEVVTWDTAMLICHDSSKVPDLFRVPDQDYPMSNGQSFDLYALIAPEDWELARKLWDTAARFVHAAYLSGVSDGRNIIAQLARGEISAERLAEHDIRLAQKMQETGRRKPITGIIKKRRAKK